MNWRKIDKSPENLALLCKEALRMDAERLAHQKEVDAEAAEVVQIKDAIRLIMNKCQMKEVSTALGVVRLVPKTVYQPDKENGGWDKIWAYVVKTKSYDLLEKRLHQAACRERYEDRKQIPGVKLFEMVVIKLGDAE